MLAPMIPSESLPLLLLLWDNPTPSTHTFPPHLHWLCPIHLSRLRPSPSLRPPSGLTCTLHLCASSRGSQLRAPGGPMARRIRPHHLASPSGPEEGRGQERKVPSKAPGALHSPASCPGPGQDDCKAASFTPHPFLPSSHSSEFRPAEIRGHAPQGETYPPQKIW